LIVAKTNEHGHHLYHADDLKWANGELHAFTKPPWVTRKRNKSYLYFGSVRYSNFVNTLGNFDNKTNGHELLHGFPQTGKAIFMEFYMLKKKILRYFENRNLSKSHFTGSLFGNSNSFRLKNL
jgi:hypothetical protein